MTEQKLISLVIDEIIEHKLSHYRMKNREYSKLNIELTQLGNKMQSVLVELSAITPLGLSGGVAPRWWK